MQLKQTPFLLCYLFLIAVLPLFSVEYKASIEDFAPIPIHKELQNTSQLLSKKPNVETLSSLKQLTEKDAQEIAQKAKSLGYLDVSVHTTSKGKDNSFHIHFHVSLGERYRLGSLNFYITNPAPCLLTTPPGVQDIPSFKENSLIDGDMISSFENELLYSLACRGYPQAKIIDILYEPDPKVKLLNVFIKLNMGPYMTFGPLFIRGNNIIDSSFFRSHIRFREGQEYNKRLLDETEQQLLKTGILTSASFSEANTLVNNNTQALRLNIQEGKLHTVGAGVSYTTTLGPGVSMLYEDRYLGNAGQKLAARVDMLQRMKQGTLTLTVPLFCEKKQNLLWIAEYDQQTYLPYHSLAGKFSCLLEQEWSKHLETLCGARIEQLRSTHILSDKKNELFKLPLQFKLSNTDSILDPTKGSLLNIRLTPSMQYIKPIFTYLHHMSTLSCYTSFFQDRATIAWKGSLGTIFGPKTYKIPLPDRFYGGSDSMLRGYKTGTVSPQNNKRELIGGESLAASSIEVRIRQKRGLGWVFFYDIGDVYTKLFTHPSSRLLQSVGTGIRYATPLGPLRFDIAFPLNRRKGIDPPFGLYFSIGQAF